MEIGWELDFDRCPQGGQLDHLSSNPLHLDNDVKLSKISLFQPSLTAKVTYADNQKKSGYLAFSGR